MLFSADTVAPEIFTEFVCIVLPPKKVAVPPLPLKAPFIVKAVFVKFTRPLEIVTFPETFTETSINEAVASGEFQTIFEKLIVSVVSLTRVPS